MGTVVYTLSNALDHHSFKSNKSKYNASQFIVSRIDLILASTAKGIHQLYLDSNYTDNPLNISRDFYIKGCTGETM